MSPTDSAARKSVLWVDDEIGFLAEAIKILEKRLGIFIDVAQTVDAALGKLRSNRYVLLITDFLLPIRLNTDGRNYKWSPNSRGALILIEKIRSGELDADGRENKRMPIIVVTQAARGAREELTTEKATNVWVFNKMELLESDPEVPDESAFVRLVKTCLDPSQEMPDAFLGH